MDNLQIIKEYVQNIHSPLTIKTISKKTNIQRKIVRRIMYDNFKDKIINNHYDKRNYWLF